MSTRADTSVHAATVRMLVSRLLRYPDDGLVADLPEVRSLVAGLPAESAEPITDFLEAITGMSVEDLRTHYVDTFDLSRRCCLYLTYYSYGDTRKRGMALLRFKHAYRMADMVLGDDELPDHLSVVLEFAALGDARVGELLLKEHRAGLEMLRLALEEQASPYARLLHALNTTLPAVQVRDRDEAIRLAHEGPPAEDVGLEPYMDPLHAERLTRA